MPGPAAHTAPRCPSSITSELGGVWGRKGRFCRPQTVCTLFPSARRESPFFSLKGKKKSVYFARTKQRVYITVRNTNYSDSYPLFSIFLRMYVISFRTYQYLCPGQGLSCSLFSINAERLEPPFAYFCTWGIPAAVCASPGARGSESRALEEERSPLSAPKPFPRPGGFPLADRCPFGRGTIFFRRLFHATSRGVPLPRAPVSSTRTKRALPAPCSPQPAPGAPPARRRHPDGDAPTGARGCGLKDRALPHASLPGRFAAATRPEQAARLLQSLKSRSDAAGGRCRGSSARTRRRGHER